MSEQVKGRAYTPEQKRVVIERLYVAWLANPDLRLGQLVGCALHQCAPLFYVEDETLVKIVEAWSKEASE